MVIINKNNGTNDDYDVHDKDDNNDDRNYINYDDGDDENYNDNDNGSDDADHRSSLKNKNFISLAYIMCPNNPFLALITFFGLMIFLTTPIIMNN